MKKPLLLELPDAYKDWLSREKETSGRPMVRIVMDLIDAQRKKKPKKKERSSILTAG